MGLGIDFNPAAAATYRPPREPKPRQIVKQPKPLRVEESRLTAAEVKVKKVAPHAFKEEETAARKTVAKVSRPLPRVQWVIPGLDTNDGMAHFAPSSVGTQNEEAVEAGMEAARNKALETYERHVAASADIRREAAATHDAKSKAADKEVRDYWKSSDDAAKAKAAAQVQAGRNLERAEARAEKARQVQAERATAAEAERAAAAEERTRVARTTRQAQPPARTGRAMATSGHGRSDAPSWRRAEAAPATPSRPARAARVAPSPSASASASGAGQASSASSPQFHPPPPPGFEHVHEQADNLVWNGGFSMPEAISLVKNGITSKRSANNSVLYYQGGHKIAVARVKALLHPPSYARR